MPIQSPEPMGLYCETPLHAAVVSWRIADHWAQTDYARMGKWTSRDERYMQQVGAIDSELEIVLRHLYLDGRIIFCIEDETGKD